MEHRHGEAGLLAFGTRWVFNIGREGFFTVRGGKDYGPFGNQQQAENELTVFLNST